MRARRVAIPVLCIAMGAGLAARPVASLAKRTYIQWRGDAIWAGALRHKNPEPGDPVARLSIPAVGLRQNIAGYAGEEALRDSAAMLEESGRVVIFGHRDMHFRALRAIETGDTVTLDRRDGAADFVVVGVEHVPPETLPGRIAETPSDALCLVTCYPFSWIGPAPERFLVTARRAG